ncbi:chromatin assembly factor 1 subunit B-like [Argiope bruennichi]|uniref:Chromatin assembly factor 1 subunit B like protein n=1 Tax=Argiope bruennichi TaxID=94029 RepID=A0A8T0FZ86_ARGBR|nr:chromatin assembly factor 1 subunit B-like [Argiope bruennichi]KAF8795575.1 Chromatin assembly factor 1 subunit B like protein [Argiope bruennichi]
MKCQVPQISWHSRDPVLSIDFQPGKRNILRLASGGTDSHVLIWYVTYQENKSIKIECASDLYRHNKSVNVVRFSPDGELLASGDDEGAMFIWQLKEREVQDTPKDEENINQEDWFPLKLLRGHLEDIYDVSWSADGNFLVSASMDNTSIIWDMQKFQKVHILSDSKGYVQGVSWDPLNSYVASLSSDRALRIYNINTKKTVYRIQRAPWTVTTEKGTMKARLFFDDTLKSYFRRLSFTPDGEFLIVPSGILERDEEKFQNTTYIFSRHALNKPVIQLPTGDKYTVAVRCNPFLYKLRGSNKESDDKENQPKTKSMIDLPYRMIFAVAACESVLLYDTEQLLPFAYISNIHYTHLTDLTWSPDGKILVASSTDGYCSFLVFGDGELGEVYIPPKEEVIIDQNTGDKVTSVLAEKAMPINILESRPAEKIETLNVPIGSDSNVTHSKTSESSVDNSKSNKKPKVCTIKNFFISPKPKPASNVLHSTEISSSNKDAKQNDKTAIKEVISPQELATESFVSKNEQLMEIDNDNSCSIEVVFDAKGATALKEETDHKIHLFGKNTPKSDEIKPSDVADIQTTVEVDLNNSNAVLSFEDSLVKIENTEKIHEVENDWKLELSQDEEIPMEVSDPMPSTSSSFSKSPTTSVALKTTNKNTKRRISLITLSTKTSLKAPKESNK